MIKEPKLNKKNNINPLCYFTLSNTRRFYLSMESLWLVGKGLTAGPIYCI